MRTALKHVFRKVFPGLMERLEWRHATRELPPEDRPKARAIYDDVCADIDLGRLKALRAETVGAGDHTAATKNYDYRSWLRKSVVYAVRLGLHKSKGQRVLDIGCGPAWFLATCRRLGHECVGADLPLDRMRDEDRRAYEIIPEMLGCAEHIHRFAVESGVPVPLDGPFDVISCWLVCFDGHWQQTPWGVDEWRYFLDDADRLLAPGGRLCLKLNDKSQWHPELIWYDEPTRALFASRGQVDGVRVTITKEG